VSLIIRIFFIALLMVIVANYIAIVVQ